VPGRKNSLDLFKINALEKERALKAGFTPATLPDKGVADAAKALENQAIRTCNFR
jgi:hypothetical protein